MSTGELSRHRSKSSASKRSVTAAATPPPSTLTPENPDREFEPCAATASFLLYAQRNVVLVVHHDTLAIERRFTLHREDVLWIQVDNTSERGSGRLAVSYDTGNTAIVWDILTGGEVSRFSAYEHMRVASFLRNGNIAFGNDQGNIILFDPSNSEHISARTIFDPVTALAPVADCRTFAIGYLNGSILIATLQPSFTILHTLSTTRAPSRITGLAWHGSSSRQKTDMLATQTADGDLRVWSLPKDARSESPNIIRVLLRSELQPPGPCWFAWSKTGRIVQFVEGETRAWDVRTKKVTYEVIPTIDGICGITLYGPTATLFTLGRNYTVQQYDITPGAAPLQVVSVQHVPAITPPTPPTILEDSNLSHARDRLTTSTASRAPSLPGVTDEESSSMSEQGGPISPLQKIAMEMDSLDAMESELRDKVMPLSPSSSRGSSASSMSSGRGRRSRKYLYDRPDSSRASSTSGYNGTEFSSGAMLPQRSAHESISIRSVSSFTSQARHQRRTSNLRKEIMRSPEEGREMAAMDLLPFTKARLQEVPLHTPHYGSGPRTAELLQREMLSCIFGWHDDIQSLLRDELSRHHPGSGSAVLLSRWLGDIGADNMASMVGSESMTSSDWMLLALSSIGAESQKRVGEAFVQRLLEKGDIHPAVAILLGLGETNEAIEVYVSQAYWLEAVLLTCLTCPADWQRQSYLIRRWGESAIQQGQAELAVRCLSCTSVETIEAYFSPRAQDAVYAAQQQRLTSPQSAEGLASPPLSPPSRTGSGRVAGLNSSLKLITTFGDRSAPPVQTEMQATPSNMVGPTPIASSALSPGAWPKSSRDVYDPSSARTATPGGFSRRKRLPSKDYIEQPKQEGAGLTAPARAVRNFSARERSAGRHGRKYSGLEDVPGSASAMEEPATAVAEPMTALRPTVYDALAPSAQIGDQPPSNSSAYGNARELSRSRQPSRGPEWDGPLTVEIVDTRFTDNLSPSLASGATGASISSAASNFTSASNLTGRSALAMLSPSATSDRVRGRAIDDYISSVEQAREKARQDRTQSRKRGESRKRDGSRGVRAGCELSEGRGRKDVRFIKAGKRSPSSPIPMSPEEIAQASQTAKIEPATTDDEDFYKVAAPLIKSPVESHKSFRSAKSEAARSTRSNSHAPKDTENFHSRIDSGRGRGTARGHGSVARSPSSPLPMSPENKTNSETEDMQSDGVRFRIRTRSSSRPTGEDLQSRRAASRSRREPSTSRKGPKNEVVNPVLQDPSNDIAKEAIAEEQAENGSEASLSISSHSRPKPNGLRRKELAAKELEERRLSLARRPSAPVIPLPGELLHSGGLILSDGLIASDGLISSGGLIPSGGGRPGMPPRANTELGNSPVSTLPPMSRSQSVDPESMSRPVPEKGRKPLEKLPPIGLPATPRAMRHPRYMSADPNEREGAPPVPDIPGNASELSSLGGSSLSQLSQVTESNFSSNAASSLQSAEKTQTSPESDTIGPLLPATTFGQQKLGHALPRSSSVPLEKLQGGPRVHPAYKGALPPSNRRMSMGRGHVRKISSSDASSLPPPAGSSLTRSIDEAISDTSSDQQIIIVPEAPDAVPQMLPELQHLAVPPPPPPPPTFHGQAGLGKGLSGVINIGVSESGHVDLSAYEVPQLPQPMERLLRPSTASPVLHRTRESVSDTFGSRWRGIGDRMRSNSRNRAKSPSQQQHDFTTTPYETKLPRYPVTHHPQESWSRAGAKSPYEQAMADQQVPMPLLPPMTSEERLNETTIPPRALPPSRSGSAMGGGGYRNPKEIRANMPPEVLQQGVYPGNGGFL